LSWEIIETLTVIPSFKNSKSSKTISFPFRLKDNLIFSLCSSLSFDLIAISNSGSVFAVVCKINTSLLNSISYSGPFGLTFFYFRKLILKSKIKMKR